MNDIHIAEFSKKLKESTALPHQQLEALPISKAIISPDIDKDTYIKYLTLMHDIVKDAEENIFPILNTVIPDLEQRNKTLLIQADLRFLGATYTTNSKPVSNGNTFSTGFAMGVLYVIEGSSLGGRVILKNIEKTLGYNSSNGATYFSGYGDKTGTYWKAFINKLSEYEKENNDGEEIIKGAYYAFDAIKKHLATHS
ncbi:biliverdin-producing heme oxygenase [Flavobacterium rhizosphaerae]|uniref:Biliverdin-producing heme oxygenase n=1 Tax=Flavobacterium rhizosphaerae TaxID=3163298 RepID=A0ABW8YW24_9FLAO